MANEELLQKANEVTTSVVGNASGGILKPAQANRFLDFVIDQSVLMQQSRVVRMRGDSMEIDKLSVGSRLLAKATEASDTGANAAVTFTKVALSTVKLRLDWEVSTESLEDNIAGDSLEDHIAQVMARQTSNDMDDLLINGDTTSSNGLLKAQDGYVKLGKASGVTHDGLGANVSRAVFDAVLRKMPNKYLQRRNELRYFSGPGIVQDTIYTLQNPNSATEATAGAPSPGSTMGDRLYSNPGGPNGGPGSTGLAPFGIPLIEVPLMPESVAGTYDSPSGVHGYIILTFPNNHIVGIQREITVYREFKPKKDTIEYTQYNRVAQNIENAEAYVIAQDVKIRA
jgi:hypothetical protein|tara:strand:+ start:4419 stop:5441 length:1023 start_codon:yes stop_codon:yes gene_type:complete